MVRTRNRRAHFLEDSIRISARRGTEDSRHRRLAASDLEKRS